MEHGDNFADRLNAAIEAKDSRVVVGLDPRVEAMPEFVQSLARADVRRAIAGFHERVIEGAAESAPAVKLQLAFYEQYGLPGMQAFADTISLAREAGMLVIVDGKRNDIDSTAAAYARAYIGRRGSGTPDDFKADALTVTPFLGRDSLLPFAAECEASGTGIFVLVKTSNPGGADIQDIEAPDGETISARLATYVDELGQSTVGASGYSSIGAVVGATFPAQAAELRRLMPRAIILVPGYGAQGGTAEDAAVNFNADGLGAVVNASRSITYPKDAPKDPSPEEFTAGIAERVRQMSAEINGALSSA